MRHPGGHWQPRFSTAARCECGDHLHKDRAIIRMGLPTRAAPASGAAAGWLALAAASAQLPAAGIVARQGATCAAPQPRRPWPARICSQQRLGGRCTAGGHQQGGLQTHQHDSRRRRKRLQVVFEAADACPLRSSTPQQQMQTASSASTGSGATPPSADHRWQGYRLDSLQWPGMCAASAVGRDSGCTCQV